MKFICCAVFHTKINCQSENENVKVSVWAHMFGCLAGVMFGLVLLKDSREEVSMMNNVKQCGLSHLKTYEIISYHNMPLCSSWTAAKVFVVDN